MGVSKFSQEDTERILYELALQGGNGHKASANLKARGINVSPDTLRSWRTRGKHAPRYDEIQHEVAGKLADKIAAEAEELAMQYAEAEREALVLLREKMPQMSAGELANAQRNLATSKALQIDKISSPLRGRPSVITQTVNPQEAIRELARLIGKEQEIFDSTAEDVTDTKELESAD